MSTAAFLLRAVNVAGNKVPMADLREIATALGASDVATYVNSGNLVCAPPGDPHAFARDLEAGIAERTGVTTDAVVRTGPQLRAALESYAFDIHEERFCHVWFLAGPITAEATADVESYDFAPDRVAVAGDDLHLRYEDGAGRSAISAPRLKRLCGGVVGTGRNLRTVAKLADLTGS